MASLIAAVTHDLDHPGVNQPFLIATSNHLAALYEVSANPCLLLLFFLNLVTHWLILASSLRPPTKLLPSAVTACSRTPADSSCRLNLLSLFAVFLLFSSYFFAFSLLFFFPKKQNVTMAHWRTERPRLKYQMMCIMSRQSGPVRCDVTTWLDGRRDVILSRLTTPRTRHFGWCEDGSHKGSWKC